MRARFGLGRCGASRFESCSCGDVGAYGTGLAIRFADLSERWRSRDAASDCGRLSIVPSNIVLTPDVSPSNSTSSFQDSERRSRIGFEVRHMTFHVRFRTKTGLPNPIAVLRLGRLLATIAAPRVRGTSDGGRRPFGPARASKGRENQTRCV